MKKIASVLIPLSCLLFPDTLFFTAFAEDDTKEDIVQTHGRCMEGALGSEKIRMVLASLNLTPDQIVQLQEVLQQTVPQLENTRRELNSADYILDEIVRANLPPDRVEAQKQKIFALERELSNDHFVIEDNIRSILSPAQKPIYEKAMRSEPCATLKNPPRH